MNAIKYAQLRSVVLMLGVSSVAPLTGCAANQTFNHVQEANLPTPEGLECRSYLVWQDQPVHDVVLSLNGTGTGTSAVVPDFMDDVLNTRPVAYLTFDKPGVHATFGDRASVTIDDEPFARHTQGTLLECAKSALQLSRSTFGPDVRFHLRGHSEGSLIELYLIDALLSQSPAAIAPIKSVVLTGLPLEPLDEILRRQFADKPKLRHAIEACDWPMMRYQFGFSCAYLADARTRLSGFSLFDRLAKAAFPTQIQVFQGVHDFNTPATFTHQLEAWNTSQGHLDLKVRYYEGGHGGTPEVRQELTQLLLNLVPQATP